MMRISKKYTLDWWEQNTVERWVPTIMTPIGMRMATSVNGKYSWETPDEALEAIKTVNKMDPTVEARITRCWKNTLQPVQAWFDDWCEQCHNHGEICVDDYIGITIRCPSCRGKRR